MGSRLKLHEELCEFLGTRNVYFEPPSSVSMNYDAIRYVRSVPRQNRANNRIYKSTNCYEVTVIEYDPDSDLADRIQQHFQMCSIDRRYKADNLNHTTLTLYY